MQSSVTAFNEAQLDSLADFYHQRHHSQWSTRYPCPISWHERLSMEEKRRKFGKFIGLRGCDTPVPVPATEDEIIERARQARLAEDEEVWRGKLAWI